jgi:hypothetical protein
MYNSQKQALMEDEAAYIKGLKDRAEEIQAHHKKKLISKLTKILMVGSAIIIILFITIIIPWYISVCVGYFIFCASVVWIKNKFIDEKSFLRKREKFLSQGLPESNFTNSMEV